MSRAPVLPLLPSSSDALDETALRAYGERLGASLSEPVIIALRGDLGAGKTTLAQAIARGAGVREDVTSPTFALVHVYEAQPRVVYHLDLYRLRGPDDLTNIGWDEIVNGDGIVLVEWPDRAGDRLPRPRIDITLSDDGTDTSRRRVSAAWTD